jgi:hypothetical protein
MARRHQNALRIDPGWPMARFEFAIEMVISTRYVMRTQQPKAAL